MGNLYLMKFTNIKINHIFIVLILLNILANINSNSLSSNGWFNPLYVKHGSDWTGICSAGTKQSPVNIIFGSNTMETKNILEVNYKLPQKEVGKKLKYDGMKLFMDVDLGTMRYYAPEKAVEEIYEAYRIEIHYPAEHYITMGDLTPRYEIEMQIFHKLSKTNNPQETNRHMKVNRSILSIPFPIGDQRQGDLFFNNMGINRYNVNQYFKMNYPKQGYEVDNHLTIPASYGKGWNYSAIEGLLNIVNSDPQMFFNNLIAKKEGNQSEAGKMFGNNRRIKLYNTR